MNIPSRLLRVLGGVTAAVLALLSGRAFSPRDVNPQAQAPHPFNRRQTAADLLPGIEAAWAEAVQNGNSALSHVIGGKVPAAGTAWEILLPTTPERLQFFFYIAIRCSETDLPALAPLVPQLLPETVLPLSAEFARVLNEAGFHAPLGPRLSFSLGALQEVQAAGLVASILCQNVTPSPPILEWLGKNGTGRMSLVFSVILASPVLTERLFARVQATPEEISGWLGLTEKSVPPASASNFDVLALLESWKGRKILAADYREMESVIENLPGHRLTLELGDTLAALPDPPRQMVLTAWGRRLVRCSHEQGVQALRELQAKTGRVEGWYGFIQEAISTDPMRASSLLNEYPRGSTRDALIRALVLERNLRGEERQAWLDQIDDPTRRQSTERESRP